MKIEVLESRCPQNHQCPAMRVCPVDAIAQIGHELPQIDMDKCIKCKKCIGFCPMGAIVSKE